MERELIDRLLGSDHYGERWAQHWLDVVRYADTAGFSNDYERSNAWRYRDYVIRSFNKDKPFNEFVVEQSPATSCAPMIPRRSIATGSAANGALGNGHDSAQRSPADLPRRPGAQRRPDVLSMPMRCCKCHDHKFDPLPTRDYYSMYAAFATTQPAEVEAEFLP